MRKRIARFTAKGNVQQWSEKLSQGWMSANAGLAGILYIDGHVNIYYGEATTMPKRYVSRLRLCMSGSTDSFFEQMKDGKTELTFGSSEARAKANNETITNYFNNLNP